MQIITVTTTCLAFVTEAWQFLAPDNYDMPDADADALDTLLADKAAVYITGLLTARGEL